MVVQEITSEAEFRTLISGPAVVFVDFYATWCPPCRAIGPYFEEFSKKHSTKGKFVRVDVDKVKSLQLWAGVTAMPTFQAYSGSRKIDEMVGAHNADLEKFILKNGKVDLGPGYTLGGGPVGEAPASSTQVDTPMEEAGDAELQQAIAMSLSQEKEQAAKPNIVCDGDSCSITPRETPAAQPSNASGKKLPDVNANFLQQIKDMGIPEVRAYKGLLFTQNASVQHALNWIMEHESDPDIDEELMVVDGPGEGGATPAQPESNLTPEEAKAKAKELVKRAREKREKEEKEAEREREMMMRKGGKDLTEIKRKHEEKELEDIQKLRKEEKRREAEEKKRMRALLEQDKLQRRVERENRERAAKNLPPLNSDEIEEIRQAMFPANAKPAASKPAPAATPAAAAAPARQVPAKRAAPAAAAAPVPNATQCVLQVRLSNGSAIMETVTPTTTIREVVDIVTSKRTDGSAPFKLMTPFPRKVYGDAELDRTVSEEGLVPRSVLQLVNA